MFRVKSVQLVTKINAQRSTRRVTKPFTRMTALPNMWARANPLMATMEVKIANKCRSRNAKRFDDSTLFENHSKCRISIFQFWHFLPIFVLLKLTCLVALFDPKLQFFRNSPKFVQYVNVARFARNVVKMWNETFSAIFKHRGLILRSLRIYPFIWCRNLFMMMFMLLIINFYKIHALAKVSILTSKFFFSGTFSST